MPPRWMDTAVPASTGATDAARVAGRTADHQTRPGVNSAVASISGSLRELREVWFSFLDVCVAAFLSLFAHVVKERRIPCELLDAGEPIVGCIESRLEHSQRERAHLQDPATPRDRLLLDRSQRHDLVHQAHLQRLLRF